MSTIDKVTKVFIDYKKIETDYLNPDSTFKELGIDSLDMFDVYAKLEEIFGIDFPDEVVDDLDSIQDIVEVIDNNVS